jgi:hypothetical protein
MATSAEPLGDFDNAVQAYRQREWETAAAQFESLLKRKPGERPSELFLERCRNHSDSPDSIGAARLGARSPVPRLH